MFTASSNKYRTHHLLIFSLWRRYLEKAKIVYTIFLETFFFLGLKYLKYIVRFLAFFGLLLVYIKIYLVMTFLSLSKHFIMIKGICFVSDGNHSYKMMGDFSFLVIGDYLFFLIYICLQMFFIN